MELETLKILTELKYQKALNGISEILAQEVKIRDQIQRLREDIHTTQSLRVDEPNMQSVGADVVWLKWATGSIKSLNSELAQVLARKEHQISRQKRALSEKNVAEIIVKSKKYKRSLEKKERSLKKSVEDSCFTDPFIF